MKYIVALLILFSLLWCSAWGSIWLGDKLYIFSAMSILPDALARIVLVFGGLAVMGLTAWATLVICDIVGMDLDD